MKFSGEIDIIISYNWKYIVTLATSLYGFYGKHISILCQFFFTYFNVIQILSNESLWKFSETQIWTYSLLRDVVLLWRLANVVTMATYSNIMSNFLCANVTQKLSNKS